MIALEMKVGTEVDATFAPVGDAGEPETLDGPAVLASSDPTIVNLTNPSADGLTVTLQKLKAGPATVTCHGDADRTSGVRDLLAEVDVTDAVTEATSIGVTFGAPRPIGGTGVPLAPTQPDATKISVVTPVAGSSTVTGTSGAVDGTITVEVSGAAPPPVTVAAAKDGSFTAIIPATVGDTLTVTAVGTLLRSKPTTVTVPAA